MKVAFLACDSLRPELEYVLDRIRGEGLFDCEIEVTFLQAGLHNDFNILKDAILHALEQITADRIILLYGAKCHPEFHEFLQGRDLVTFPQSNCFEMILGSRMQEIDHTTKTFYLIPGYMDYMLYYFQNWDAVSLRQGLGYYDRLLLLDTGVREITDEQILEFFEYTQVPIEVEKVDLALFKGSIAAAIRQAVEKTLQT